MLVPQEIKVRWISTPAQTYIFGNGHRIGGRGRDRIRHRRRHTGGRNNGHILDVGLDVRDGCRDGRRYGGWDVHGGGDDRGLSGIANNRACLNLGVVDGDGRLLGHRVRGRLGDRRRHENCGLERLGGGVRLDLSLRGRGRLRPRCRVGDGSRDGIRLDDRLGQGRRHGAVESVVARDSNRIGEDGGVRAVAGCW